MFALPVRVIHHSVGSVGSLISICKHRRKIDVIKFADHLICLALSPIIVVAATIRTFIQVILCSYHDPYEYIFDEDLSLPVTTIFALKAVIWRKPEIAEWQKPRLIEYLYPNQYHPTPNPQLESVAKLIVEMIDEFKKRNPDGSLKYSLDTQRQFFKELGKRLIDGGCPEGVIIFIKTEKARLAFPPPAERLEHFLKLVLTATIEKMQFTLIKYKRQDRDEPHSNVTSYLKSILYPLFGLSAAKEIEGDRFKDTRGKKWMAHNMFTDNIIMCMFFNELSVDGFVEAMEFWINQPGNEDLKQHLYQTVLAPDDNNKPEYHETNMNRFFKLGLFTQDMKKEGVLRVVEKYARVIDTLQAANEEFQIMKKNPEAFWKKAIKIRTQMIAEAQEVAAAEALTP